MVANHFFLFLFIRFWVVAMVSSMNVMNAIGSKSQGQRKDLSWKYSTQVSIPGEREGKKKKAMWT